MQLFSMYRMHRSKGTGLTVEKQKSTQHRLTNGVRELCYKRYLSPQVWIPHSSHWAEWFKNLHTGAASTNSLPLWKDFQSKCTFHCPFTHLHSTPLGGCNSTRHFIFRAGPQDGKQTVWEGISHMGLGSMFLMWELGQAYKTLPPILTLAHFPRKRGGLPRLPPVGSAPNQYCGVPAPRYPWNRKGRIAPSSPSASLCRAPVAEPSKWEPEFPAFVPVSWHSTGTDTTDINIVLCLLFCVFLCLGAASAIFNLRPFLHILHIWIQLWICTNQSSHKVHSDPTVERLANLDSSSLPLSFLIRQCSALQDYPLSFFPNWWEMKWYWGQQPQWRFTRDKTNLFGAIHYFCNLFKQSQVTFGKSPSHISPSSLWSYGHHINANKGIRYKRWARPRVLGFIR